MSDPIYHYVIAAAALGGLLLFAVVLMAGFGVWVAGRNGKSAKPAPRRLP